MPNSIRLSEIVAIWEVLHVKDTGDIGFSDFESAVEEIIEVRNDIPSANLTAI